MKNNSRDKWLQHFEQYQTQEITPCFNTINMTSSSGSSHGDGGGSAAQEVVGRRSRTPRRVVPTTLLNANPSNFRTLVQKFTGRSSGCEFNRRKGPVTLDFRSPTNVSKEAIFPTSGYNLDHALDQHVSNAQSHVTLSSGTEATTSYHSVLDQDHDLLREYSGNNSYYDDGFNHMDIDGYQNDFLQETATLEEFMMRDLDL